MSDFGKIKASGIREVDNPVNPETDIKENSIGKNENNLKNFQFFWFVATFVIFLLFGRTFYLQIIRGGYYKDVAENNRIRSVAIKAPRGIIRDKNGQVLARNIPSFDAVFVPIDLPKDNQERGSVFSQLSLALNMDAKEVRSIIEEVDENSKNSFLLKEGINYEDALILTEKLQDIRGVYLDKTARRDYVDGEIFSHIIGYEGKITQEEKLKNPDYLMTDYIGKNGLEYFYEKELHGKHGEHRMEVDSNGDIKEDLGVINPTLGDELILHLDADLQRKSYEILRKTLDENKDASGASLVAIDPRNGGILALVSLPSYDNNLFAKGISQQQYSDLINDERKPLLNRVINGEYPPGSTFKPLISVAALEEDVINENTTIDCAGVISINQWRFPDWKAHGLTDIKKAIAESCDVFFYAVGGGWGNIKGLGVDKMNSYAKLFGLGDLTGVDLPWESKGNVPNEEWKFKKFGENWYIGNSYHFSIGQGFVTATPLQMANSIATIANGGKLFSPRLVDRIKKPNGEEEIIEPKVVRENFSSPESIEITRAGMRETVASGSGSGHSLNDLKVETAGKTGTAQFGNEDKTHSWYVSFAPYNNPEIAMAVLVDGGGEGHSFATPITKDIYRWYFEERNK